MCLGMYVKHIVNSSRFPALATLIIIIIKTVKQHYAVCLRSAYLNMYIPCKLGRERLNIHIIAVSLCGFSCPPHTYKHNSPECIYFII